MIKYKVCWDKIEQVEVLRETSAYVFFARRDFRGKNQRDKKRSHWCRYFNSGEEAINYLREKYNSEIMRLKQEIDRQRTKLALLERSPWIHGSPL
jgi:hypothetical protein